MSDAEDQLVEFVTDTTYKDLPDRTVEFTKQLALKTMAGMLAGSVHPTGRKTSKYLSSKKGSREEAGVIGCGFETALQDAVFANATFAHASELEDNMMDPQRGISAWDITTFPLTFTLADNFRLSGKEFITASAIGLEVLARLGSPPIKGPTNDIGLQVSGTAASTAAAKAMGSDADEILNGLGIAMGGGFIFLPNTGTDAHFFDSVFQTVRGFQSAELARQGFTGNPKLDTLFTSIYRDDAVPPADVLNGLGEDWLFHNIGIKKYPVCYYTHRHIDATIELVEDHDIAPDQIESVETDIGPIEGEIVSRERPTTYEDAQFSLQHLLGAATIDRDVSYPHLEKETLFDDEYVAAREKVDVNIRSDWEEVPLSDPAVVEITLDDGTTVRNEREYMIGGPHEPLPESRFKELYRKFTSGIISDEIIDETTEAILNIEDRADMELLMDKVTYRRASR